MTGDVAKPAKVPERRNVGEAHVYSPAHLIARADQMVNAGFLERCRNGGLKLTLPQLFYLCAVSSSPGCHQAAAARMVGMDTPTGALVISALERKGFVERRQSEADKRRKTIQVTKAGSAAMMRGLPFLASAISDLMAPVPPADRQALGDMLATIAAHKLASPPDLCSADGHPIAVPTHLPPDVLPGYLLGRCLQIAVALIAPALAPFKLTIRQYVVLAVLNFMGPCNLTALTHAMGSERSSLAIVLPSLEERGLVSVERDRDRALTIELTATGVALLARARPVAEAANDHIASDLSQMERMEFARVLAHMLRHHGQLLDLSGIAGNGPGA